MRPAIACNTRPCIRHAGLVVSWEVRQQGHRWHSNPWCTNSMQFRPANEDSACGFVWTCWVNIPNEIAIENRDNDQQNHWVNGVHYFQTNPCACRKFITLILTSSGHWMIFWREKLWKCKSSWNNSCKIWINKCPAPWPARTEIESCKGFQDKL